MPRPNKPAEPLSGRRPFHGQPRDPGLTLVDGRTHVERIDEIKLSFPNKGARCSPRRGQCRQGLIRAFDEGRADIPATMSTSSTARWTSGTGETFCDIQVVGPGRGSPPTAGQRGKAALRRRLSGPSSRRPLEQPEEGASSETGRAGGCGCGSTPVRLSMERRDYGGPSYPYVHGQAGKANTRPSCEGCVTAVLSQPTPVRPRRELSADVDLGGGSTGAVIAIAVAGDPQRVDAD
jgi:hypothetical protein